MQSRIDRTQPEIVAALERAGWEVLSLAPMGAGVPDLVASKGGRTVMLECKDGTLPPSRRMLTPAECDFFDSWQGEVYVVESAERGAGNIGGSMTTPWMLVAGCVIIGWLLPEILAAFSSRRIPWTMNALAALAAGLIAGSFV